MGIDINGLRFLLYAKSAGVDFTKTAMIGRQTIQLGFDQFCSVFRAEFNHDIDLITLEEIYSQKYCDQLLSYLGAGVVHSYDYSDYEGSTHVHDFNQPIPEDYFAQYTTIIEGGTLEHVFDFPTAIKNCMQMINVGGHYLGMSPTNNYMGHGFYQFSPELYFRVFSRDNGFRIEHMILHEGSEKKKWLKVPDPQEIKRRVGMMNSKPTLLLILSTRLADRPIFSASPQQSDYVAKWNEIKPEMKVTLTTNRSVNLKRWILRFVKKRIRGVLKRNNAAPVFSPFDPYEFLDKGEFDNVP